MIAILIYTDDLMMLKGAPMIEPIALLVTPLLLLLIALRWVFKG